MSRTLVKSQSAILCQKWQQGLQVLKYPVISKIVQYWRSQWKNHLTTLLIALLALVAVQAWQNRDVPSGAAPDFTVMLVTGETQSLRQWLGAHPGQAVALHFWADWCPICRAEENSITRLSRDWPILTIAMQSGDAARVRGVLAKRELPWTTALDAQGQISRSYGLKAVPAFVVVDSNGQLRFVATGFTSEIGMRWRLWWAQWG